MGDSVSREAATVRDVYTPRWVRATRYVLPLRECHSLLGLVEADDLGTCLVERFRWLVAPRSTVARAAPVHGGLTDDPAAELHDLFARMVSPL